jgi:ATP-dependent helicase YprA (DUF1998 family)
MIVTTGTGSGKTECCLMPVVNALLREQEAEGRLDDGVRAIVIYPMNALINDQVKRLREIFIDSDITFGVYNGNTEQKEKDGIRNTVVHTDLNLCRTSEYPVTRCARNLRTS